MDWAYWIFFVMGMGTLLLTPGPTTLTVTSYTLKYGRSAVPFLVLGVSLADLTYMTVGLSIHSALLTVSENLFLALKIFGLCYVLYLAWGLWHSSGVKLKEGEGEQTDRAGFHITAQIFLVTITNPKGMLFLFVLLPTLMPPDGLTLARAVIMTLVFVLMSAVNITFWGLLSGTALRRFTTWPHVGKLSAVILLTSVALVWGLDYL